jgi:hypothetical protein
MAHCARNYKCDLDDPAVDYLQASLQVVHKAVASTQLAHFESAIVQQ